MPITDADIAVYANEVSAQFTEAQRREASSRNARDKHVAPGLIDAVAPLLYAAASEAASAIARQASPDATLDERRTSYRHSATPKGVSVSLTLILAEPAQLWIAQHADGQLASVQAYPHRLVAAKGKMFSTGPKFEARGDGVLITGSKGLAAWVDQMREAYA